MGCSLVTQQLSPRVHFEFFCKNYSCSLETYYMKKNQEKQGIILAYFLWLDFGFKGV